MVHYTARDSNARNDARQSEGEVLIANIGGNKTSEEGRQTTDDKGNLFRNVSLYQV
jgi:hypothetical protein